MTDDGDNDGLSEQTAAFVAREDALESAMPVLAEFFHIVRCPNHTKEEREQAYEAACTAWDTLEDSYIREVTLTEGHGEHGGEGQIGGASTLEIHDTETGKTMHVHPGSRAIN